MDEIVENKNIFLTGDPGIGKTTVIKKVISRLDKTKIKGFFTEEKRENNERIGFVIKTIDHKQAYLAHINLDTDFKLGKYFISVENINKYIVKSIKPDNNSLIIIDEIGKMECFSEEFKDMVLKVLESSNKVLGTISVSKFEFIREIYRRKDTEMINVNLKNRDRLADKIIKNWFLNQFS